jgi:hypothetical protein
VGYTIDTGESEFSEGTGRRSRAPIVVADNPFNNVSWNGPRHVRNGGLRHLQAVDVSVVTHQQPSSLPDRPPVLDLDQCSFVFMSAFNFVCVARWLWSST